MSRKILAIVGIFLAGGLGVTLSSLMPQAAEAGFRLN
jgi:hypothetical protein